MADRRLFFGVLIAAFAIRIYDVDASPLELHADELAGLVGIANILHGSAPVVPYFDLRIEYLPLYGAVESLSVALLGATPFAVRLPAVLFGVAAVAALRWLVVELGALAPFANAVALLFAVLPWAFDLSRLGWENAALFPFLLGGLAALARGLRLGRTRPLVLAGALVGVGAYSYRAEPFDAVVLGLAIALSRFRRARAGLAGLTLGVAVASAIVAPLAVALARDPHFFWRDTNIATFGHGYTPAAFATFARNYAAHFAIVPLFGQGDGILDHGPRYGVLYWWMLPFVVIGIVVAPSILGRANAFVAYVWLLAYPLGGALTNDGVPDFPRTMIGAPLACLLAITGVQFAALAIGRATALERSGRRVAAFALALVAGIATLDFLRTYYFVYPVASADAFKVGTASLFRQVRRLAPGHARVCFGSLDWYNYVTLVDYYLADVPLAPVEGVSERCRLPGTLIVVDDPAKTIPPARLLATQPHRDGSTMSYIYDVP